MANNNMYRRQVGYIKKGGGVDFAAACAEERIKGGRTLRITSEGAEIYDEKASMR